MTKMCHSLEVLDSLHRYSLLLQYFSPALLYSTMNSFLFVVNSSTFMRKALCEAWAMASLFFFYVISSRGRQKILKCAADAYFRVCLYIFADNFDPSETKNCEVSAFSIRKDSCEFL